MISKMSILAALVSHAFATPHERRMTVRESRPNAPAGFVRSGTPDADTNIDLRIGLVQSNPQGLSEQLYAVSTPGSPSYGRHLSKDEVSAAAT